MTGEREDPNPGGRVVLLGDNGLGVRVLQELRELGIAVTAVCTRLVGGLTLALAFGLVTDAIVGARLLRALGQYPIPRRDHVVVCGVGTTGTTIIEALDRAGVRCVAVERLEETCQARVMAVSSTPFPVLDLEVAPGDEMQVVGTSRGLVELAHLVAPSALTAASDINDQRDGTTR